MTKEHSQDMPPVTGDPVLINVLATAQRFAAWYAEYLSAGAHPHATPSCEGDGQGDDAHNWHGEGQGDARGDIQGSTQGDIGQPGEDLIRQLQHAVFDLMAAVHEMNRQCAATPPANDRLNSRVVALTTDIHVAARRRIGGGGGQARGGRAGEARTR